MFLKYLTVTESDTESHLLTSFIHSGSYYHHLETTENSCALCGYGCFICCASPYVGFCKTKFVFSHSLNGPMTVDRKSAWLSTTGDCATVEKTKNSSSFCSAHHKNTWVTMSHVLRHRDRDNCNEMRQFDSCTKHCNRAWFRMTFEEAGVHGKLRRQRQLTCALFKICEAERTKALGALIWAYKSVSLFSEGQSHSSTSVPQQAPQKSRA